VGLVVKSGCWKNGGPGKNAGAISKDGLNHTDLELARPVHVVMHSVEPTPRD